MSILSRLGHDTISRLEKAAARRFIEAEWLVEGKHHLTAIYFFGYAVEITVGTAYFRMKGYGLLDPLLPVDRNKALIAAKGRSLMTDKSHPIDGWAELLIEEKGALFPPAFERKIERAIRNKTVELRDNWGPKLRYRSMDATEEQVKAAREAADWFLKKFPKF